MAEANLKCGAEDHVAGDQGSDIKAETLPEGGRTAKGDFLDHRGEGHEPAILGSSEPAFLGIQRKDIIFLEIAIREI
jgi:hypothetical protein